FELPKLILPSSLEVYEPELVEDVNTTLSGSRGKITNNYTIVPQYKGKYPIPSVAFSYFDPEKNVYKTLTSKQLVVDVYEGPTNDANVASTDAGVVKQSVNADDNQFRFIKLSTTLTEKSDSVFFGSTLYYLLLLLPL